MCEVGGRNVTIPAVTVLERTDPLLPLWGDLVVLLGMSAVFGALGYVILNTWKHPGKHYSCRVSCPAPKINCCPRVKGAETKDSTAADIERYTEYGTHS